MHTYFNITNYAFQWIRINILLYISQLPDSLLCTIETKFKCLNFEKCNLRLIHSYF